MCMLSVCCMHEHTYFDLFLCSYIVSCHLLTTFTLGSVFISYSKNKLHQTWAQSLPFKSRLCKRAIMHICPFVHYQCIQTHIHMPSVNHWYILLTSHKFSCYQLLTTVNVKQHHASCTILLSYHLIFHKIRIQQMPLVKAMAHCQLVKLFKQVSLVVASIKQLTTNYKQEYDWLGRMNLHYGWQNV